jgi:transcription termination/antitermination protein NusA
MEILQVADAVAREKNIDREEVVQAMEEAIQKAARSKYGIENDIRAKISRSNGMISLHRYREVIEDDAEMESDARQLTLTDALKIKSDVEVGDFLIDDLPPLDFGRVAAQTAKQVINQKVREAVRIREFEEYKDRSGDIVNGTVKRVDFGNITVDLGRAEGVIRREEGIPRERLKMGDRVRAYVMDVRQEQRGPQIFLSRTHPEFMAKLFKQEVPEIYDGNIQIMAVARDPGSRAKIAVFARDSSVDPVGACVGVRGSRVQAVVQELQGEKVDIVPWSPDMATFIVNALAPAAVAKVVMDEEERRIDVIVPEDQLSLAIGRRGQNVRLASMLTGWNIDIMNEDEHGKKRAEETTRRTEMFMNALDVDDVLAQLLIVEGFTSVDDLAYIDFEELISIEGFDEDVARELQNRALVFCTNRDNALQEKIASLSISEDLLAFEGLTKEQVVKLAEGGVKTTDDLADLAGDELIEMLGDGSMKPHDADKLIMKARESWFASDEESAA